MLFQSYYITGVIGMYYNNQNLEYRNLIMGLNKKIPIYHGKRVYPINFDNAATTPPFKSVINAIESFSSMYSSIHRGSGYKSLVSSEFYEESRKIICDFVHCNYKENAVIYVQNTTEAINKVSYLLASQYQDAVVISTRMEHHSNDLPWRDKFHVDYVNIDKLGKLDLNDLESKLKKYNGKVKLVTVTGASNVTGYINPINEIARMSHKFGAHILVDGAQLVPHCKVDMMSSTREEHIDFLVFSAHKMYAPFGIGVLIGPKNIFEKVPPDYSGGGTIDLVSDNDVVWAEPPEKNEAGTPNLMGVVALIAAIETLNKLGMEKVEEYEKNLYNYAVKSLTKISNLDIYCDLDKNCDKVAIIPFNLKNVYHEVTAEILSSDFGIAVRTGCFCAQPYVQRLLNVNKAEVDYYKENLNAKRQGMVRVSFSFYNTFDEIDILIRGLKKIR